MTYPKTWHRHRLTDTVTFVISHARWPTLTELLIEPEAQQRSFAAARNDPNRSTGSHYAVLVSVTVPAGTSWADTLDHLRARVPVEYLHLPVKVDLPAAAGTADRRISLPQAAS